MTSNHWEGALIASHGLLARVAILIYLYLFKHTSVMAVLSYPWCFTRQTSVDQCFPTRLSTSDQPYYFMRPILHIVAHVHMHLFYSTGLCLCVAELRRLWPLTEHHSVGSEVKGHCVCEVAAYGPPGGIL